MDAHTMPKDINLASTKVAFEERLDLAQVQRYPRLMMKIFVLYSTVESKDGEAVSFYSKRLLIASYIGQGDDLAQFSLHISLVDVHGIHWKFESIGLFHLEQLVRFQEV